MALKRLWTGLKGLINDAAETAADENAIPELRQNIREAKTEIANQDKNIANTRAERKLADNEVAALAKKIADYEQDVRDFAADNNMGLATKIAGEITKLKPQLETATQRRDVLLENENKMITITQNLKQQITAMEQEIAMIESTEKLQKAQAATLNVTSGFDSKSKTAIEAMERTKQRQAKRAAELEAATELAAERSAPSGLDAEIAKARNGAEQDAQSELERILGGK